MLELALQFISIGGGNVICSSKILSILPSGSRIADRLLSEAKKTSRFVSLTSGHKARSLILMDNGLVVSSRLRTETLYKRLNEAPDGSGIQYKNDTRPVYHYVEDEPDDLSEEEIEDMEEENEDGDDSDFTSEDDTDEPEDEDCCLDLGGGQ